MALVATLVFLSRPVNVSTRGSEGTSPLAVNGQLSTVNRRCQLSTVNRRCQPSTLLFRAFALEREPIAAPAQCLDRLDRIVRVELAAQTADKDFDRVAVAIE